jgi:hypothetical protein
LKRADKKHFSLKKGGNKMGMTEDKEKMIELSMKIKNLMVEEFGELSPTQIFGVLEEIKMFIFSATHDIAKKAEREFQAGKAS